LKEVMALLVSADINLQLTNKTLAISSLPNSMTLMSKRSSHSPSTTLIPSIALKSLLHSILLSLEKQTLTFMNVKD
jgi:hypothetical protein